MKSVELAVVTNADFVLTLESVETTRRVVSCSK
jgi:hypothetical protein